MKKKKGFTLIELMAVIIILGVISAITVPIISKILDSSKRGTFSSSLDAIERKVYQVCSDNLLKKEEITNVYTIIDGEISPEISLKGTLPDGIINVSNKCKIAYSLTNKDYTATKQMTSDTPVIKNGNNVKLDVLLPSGWVLHNNKVSPTELKLGDVISIGSENFYVFSNDGSSIKAISKYNLKVGGTYISSWIPLGSDATGLQDESIKGFVTGQTERYGTTPFASETQKGTNYSDYNGSIVEGYVNAYKETLKQLGAVIANASLITKEELDSLKCDSSNTTCNGAPSYITETSYWTSSPSDTINIWYVSSDKSMKTANCGHFYDFGVRPVIDIPISAME